MSLTSPPSNDLCRRMRSDWDERVKHDYRFWMSDGTDGDSAMWAAGERDFNIIAAGLNSGSSSWTALEIGCGVGRLIRPAAKIFARVIGVDVSETAIAHARRLLSDIGNAELLAGSGADLEGIASNSIDFAFSFAAFTNMPLAAASRYLPELARVLRPGGEMRLQVYIGREQETFAEDTLSIRSFEKERFLGAIELAGFRVAALDELRLPFEVSNEESGVTAMMARCIRTDAAAEPAEVIEQALTSKAEAAAGEEWGGSVTEYLMAIHRAQEHLDNGRLEEARAALEFAVEHFANPEPDVVALLEQMRKDSSAGAQPQAPRTEVRELGRVYSESIFKTNLELVQRRFPELAAQLVSVPVNGALQVELGPEGLPAMIYQGVPLDQPDKPRRAGEVWAERTLASERIREAENLAVVGFAGGYHLEALQRLSSGRALHVIEPNAEVLKASLGLRDLRPLLDKLASLTTSSSEFERMLDKSGKLEIAIQPQTQVTAREEVDKIKRLFWSARGLNELRPSIAVVGPIYGGTLPIAGYAAQALGSMKQRVRFFDLGSFHKSYLDLEGFVKSKQRAGVLQGHYVEMLSQIVLEGISERPVDIVICMAQAPLSPRVLTELRNRGIITAMWFVEDCRRFTTWREIARYYDYMFLIQRGEIQAHVEAAGAGRAEYLPLACDPSVHCPVELTDEERQRWGSAVSFVGAGYNNRQQMFATLTGRDFKIWGTEWPGCAPFDKFVQERGRRISPEEYVKIFNATQVNINLHSSMERDGVEPFGDFVNPRTFELAACGAFQLVDNRTLLPELFGVGTEVATFSDRREMEDKIDYYLARPEERREISARAREHVLREHTYEQRLRSMLGCIYADRFEQLHERAANGPWNAALKTSKRYPELHEKFQKLYELGEDPTLNALASLIQQGKGTLSETEQKLLFLYHVKSQISYVNDLREGKTK